MMNTTMSEMSKASEITTTSEKHIQTSGCVCAPANCEPKRPRDQETPKTTEDIATAGKVVVGLMNLPAKEEDEDEANKERYIKSTKNHGVLGELMDAEADAEATGSFDKMTGWPEGGIASVGNIIDNMSGCVRARLKWCPRS